LQPFLDSTDIINNPEEMSQRASRDGYLYIRGLLPRDKLEDLRMLWLEISRRGGWVNTDSPLEEAFADLNGFCVEPQPEYLKTYGQIYKLQEFHAIQHHPNLVGLFERLLGGPVLPHPAIIGRTIFPQKEEFTTPPHQDFIPIQGTTETYTAWFPLSDLTPERGGVKLVPGSHTKGIYQFEPALGAGGLGITDDLGDNWVYSPVAQGDVVVFHSLTVHQGIPCAGKHLRISVDARYQLASEPINPNCLLPHARPEVNWEDVYQDWPETDLKYYWKRLNLKTKSYDNSYHDQRDKMAFEMAERGDARAVSSLQRVASRDTDPKKRRRASELLTLLEKKDDSRFSEKS
jgi:hypothetical protein